MQRVQFQTRSAHGPHLALGIDGELPLRPVVVAAGLLLLLLLSLLLKKKPLWNQTKNQLRRST